MPKLARVSSKSQVVIPAPYRKKLKIFSAVIMEEEDGKIVMTPSGSFKEAFGLGGKELIQAARDLHGDRRKEVESERKKLRDYTGFLFLYYAGAASDKPCFNRIISGATRGIISEVNLAEFHYKVGRLKGIETADVWYQQIERRIFLS